MIQRHFLLHVLYFRPSITFENAADPEIREHSELGHWGLAIVETISHQRKLTKLGGGKTVEDTKERDTVDTTSYIDPAVGDNVRADKITWHQRCF
jgi:hypothetical protein